MAGPAPTVTVIADLFEHVHTVFTAAIAAGVGRAAAFAAPLFWACCSLYLVLLALRYAFGRVEDPLRVALWQFVKWLFMGTFVLGVSAYQVHIVGLLQDTPAQLVSLFVGNGGTGRPYVALDAALEQGDRVAKEFIRQVSGMAPIDGIFWILCSLAAAIFTYAVVGIGAALLLFAHLGIAIMAIVGPIFICALFFESTKPMFEGWVRQCINYVVMVMLVSIQIAIMFGLWELSLTTAAAGAKGGWTVFAPAFIIGVVVLVFYYLLPSKAAALAGGVSVSGFAAMAWGWAQARSGGRTLGALRPNAIGRMFNPALQRGLPGDVAAVKAGYSKGKQWARAAFVAPLSAGPGTPSPGKGPMGRRHS